jgi:hypothetical protein
MPQLTANAQQHRLGIPQCLLANHAPDYRPKELEISSMSALTRVSDSNSDDSDIKMKPFPAVMEHGSSSNEKERMNEESETWANLWSGIDESHFAEEHYPFFS